MPSGLIWGFSFVVRTLLCWGGPPTPPPHEDRLKGGLPSAVIPIAHTPVAASAAETTYSGQALSKEAQGGLRDTDSRAVMARGTRAGELEGGQRGMGGDGRRLALGW